MYEIYRAIQLFFHLSERQNIKVDFSITSQRDFVDLGGWEIVRYITSQTLPRTHSVKYSLAQCRRVFLFIFSFFVLKFLSISMSKLSVASSLDMDMDEKCNQIFFHRIRVIAREKKRDALLDHSCWTHLILLGHSPHIYLQYHTFIDFAFFKIISI